MTTTRQDWAEAWAAVKTAARKEWMVLAALALIASAPLWSTDGDRITVSVLLVMMCAAAAVAVVIIAAQRALLHEVIADWRKDGERWQRLVERALDAGDK